MTFLPPRAGLNIFLGLELQAVAFVLSADDMQGLVVHEPRSTELAVEKFRLFRRWVNSYFGRSQYAVITYSLL